MNKQPQNNVIQILKTDYVSIIIIAIWTILLNGYRLFLHPIGIDTEQALCSFNTNLNWTIGCGRFVSAAIRHIVMPFSFNYVIATVIIIVGTIGAMLGYLYCFKYFGIKNKASRLLFALIYISYPVWAEQNYFLCSAHANIIGLVLSVYSAYNLTIWIAEKKEFKYALLACLSTVLATGIYQTFFYLIIANTVVFLFIKSYNTGMNFTSLFIAFIRLASVVISAFLIYYICSKICITLFYDPRMDYAGLTDAQAYILSQVSWDKKTALSCFSAILYYIEKCISSYTAFGTPLYLLSSFTVLIMLIFQKIVNRKKSTCGLLLLWLGINICPFLGCFVKGGGISAREQLILPSIFAFSCAFILEHISQITAYVKKEEFQLANALTKLSTVIFFYTAFYFAGVQMQLNHTDYIRYKADAELANSIIHDIEKFDSDYSNKKVVFIGYKSWNAPNYLVKGEIIGTSIFAWDINENVGINYRVYGFMQSLGYNYIKPSIEEVRQIQNLETDADSYPHDGYIFNRGDIIIVRLN